MSSYKKSFGRFLFNQESEGGTCHLLIHMNAKNVLLIEFSNHERLTYLQKMTTQTGRLFMHCFPTQRVQNNK